MERIIRIFTDGSAIGNPGPGGWGAVVIDGKKRREMSGANPWTNISEMELLAAVEALRSIPRGSRIELYSDSELLIHGMRGFVFRWQSQGWRNRRGAALQHRDLWLQLLQFNLEFHIRWKWLRGHNGHPTGGIHDTLSSAFLAAGGNWQYWSRPFPGWAQEKKTVAVYMTHIWRLWDTQ